ncbi:Mov34/MPN/PAD-1 family protein [Burkholderia gladioli]|uniref:Mov34/MPN/PAD-1 family protein n=1 Tax=Burkholderia gladioli TaxID=28095 RepID=UPI0016400390|nr:Mov34/MPN/PAD-1 family protein [Burkholderia gladioli]
MDDQFVLGQVDEVAALVFTNPLVADGLVLIEGNVLFVIAQHRQLTKQTTEAGGILLGYRRGAHLHITHLTVPGPKDVATRVSFKRRDPCHQKQALRAWEQSGHTVDYLGEWHTHPEVSPSPSSTDRRAWTEILQKRNELHAFLIAGTEEMLWAGCATMSDLKRLIPLNFADDSIHNI